MRNFIELSPKGRDKKLLVNLNTAYFRYDTEGDVIVHPMEGGIYVILESWDEVKRKITEVG